MDFTSPRPILGIVGALVLSACGAQDATVPEPTKEARQPKTLRPIPIADAATRARRPFEAPVRLTSEAREPGLLRVRVDSEIAVPVAQVRIWGADGATVVSGQPTLRDLDPADPQTLAIEYRLDGVRGRIAVALVTDEQPRGRRVVQSFAVGEPQTPTPIVEGKSTPGAPAQQRVHVLPARRK